MMIWLFMALTLTGCQVMARRRDPQPRPDILKSGICAMAARNQTLPCCKDAWTKYEEYRYAIRKPPPHYKLCSEDGYYESLQCKPFVGCECVDQMTGESNGTENCLEGLDIMDICDQRELVTKRRVMKEGSCATSSKNKGGPCCQALWKTYEYMCRNPKLAGSKLFLFWGTECRLNDGFYLPKQCPGNGICHCVDKDGKKYKAHVKEYGEKCPPITTTTATATTKPQLPPS